jgi:hypothetical protein
VLLLLLLLWRLFQAKFRGYFVPARPEKNAVEGQRMSDSFVEERRAGLQKYLQKLAAHPVIGPSDVSSSRLPPASAQQQASAVHVGWPTYYLLLGYQQPHLLL